MRAALRNAKIARAKALRPHVRGLWLKPGGRTGMARGIANRHYGDGPLRTVYGAAEGVPVPHIIPKHELRRRRQAEQRARERRD